MNINSLDPESEALYRVIRGEAPQDLQVPNSEDAEFAASIHQTAQNIQANPLFQADLENRLRRISPTVQKPAHQWFSGFTKNLAWVTAAVMIIIAVSWSIRTLLPQPLTAATPTMLTSSSENEEPTSTPLPTRIAGTPSVKSTPEGEVFTSPIFPDDSIIMQPDFPPSPSEMKVYTQNIAESLTIEDGLNLAAQLGFSGKAYNVETEGDRIFSFYVTDGIHRLLVFSMQHFFYISNYHNFMEVSKQDTPTTEEQVSIAESYLKEHGLLDFPYRIQTEDPVPGSVRFIQLLDDKTITYGNMGDPEITVEVSSKGEIKSINYQKFDFTEGGTYPIISVEQAWQTIQSSEFPEGVDTYSHSISRELNEMWQRDYPLGERVELFGYLEILKPADASDTPLIFLHNYPLQGNLQALAESATPNQFTHIWGQFQADENGNRYFQVEGWQPSTFELQTLEGTIQRQDGQGYLVEEKNRWLLPGLPETIPSDKPLFVDGIALESEATFEWASISTKMGGGGGGGGGTGFVALNLDRAPTPIPEPTETPLPLPQVGDRLDGIEGKPMLTYFKHTDGSQTLSAYMNLQPSPEWPGGLSLDLVGDGLAGIEAYHQLPVKIWGTITKINQSTPEITVERFEPLYPDLKAQAWLGTMELVNLGVNTVLLFTDQSGDQYILNTSIETEAKTPSSDMAYVVEGAVYPDQTYEGYPVIHDFMMFGAQGMQNLDDYKPHSITPITLDASESYAGKQTITIEKIELVYYTADLQYELPDGSLSPTYAQPAWRFYGHYATGDVFVLLVQALSDEYLQ